MAENKKARATKARAKKVAIVGWACATRDQAPFNDKSFEIWGCNELGIHMPEGRFDVWFEVHTRREMLCELRDRVEWLAKQGKPAYVFEPFPEIPTAQLYPREEMFQRFGRKYFNSSIDWMLALAIFEGFEEIHIYGVEMAMDTEYAHQKPSCSYWLGRAEGAGIKVYVPEECCLLKSPYLYGVDTPPESQGPVPLSMLRKRHSSALKKREEHIRSAHVCEGIAVGTDFVIKQLIDYQRRTGLLPPPLPGEENVPPSG